MSERFSPMQLAAAINKNEIDPTEIVYALIEDRLLMEDDCELTANETALALFLCDASPEDEETIRQFILGATDQTHSILN